MWRIACWCGALALLVVESPAKADEAARARMQVQVASTPANVGVERAKARWLFKKKMVDEWYRLMLWRGGSGYGRLGVRKARLASPPANLLYAVGEGDAAAGEFVQRVAGRAARSQFRKDFRRVAGADAELAALGIAAEELERVILDRYYVRSRRTSDLEGERMTILLRRTGGPTRATVDSLTGEYVLGSVPYRTTIGANTLEADCGAQEGEVAIIGGGGGGGGGSVDSFFDVFFMLPGPPTPGGAAVTVNRLLLERMPGGMVDGDSNGDGLVNGLDVVAFQACYTGAGGGPISPQCLFADMLGGTDDDCDGADNDCDGCDWKQLKEKLADAGEPAPEAIPPGTDYYQVPPGGAWIEFGGASTLPPIPADFFFPGSEPFSGRVELMGYQRNWDYQYDPMGRVTREVVMEKKEWAELSSGSDSIEIEIKELELRSKEPIMIRESPTAGARGREYGYEVRITVTDNNSPPKSATMMIREGPDHSGGEYEIHSGAVGGVGLMMEFTAVGVRESPTAGYRAALKWYPPAPVAMDSEQPGDWKKKQKIEEVLYGGHPQPFQDFYPQPVLAGGLSMVLLLDGGGTGRIPLRNLLPTQACCLADARCVDIPAADCAALLGDSQGPDTLCIALPAPACSPMKWAQPPVPATAPPADPTFHGWDEHSVWNLEPDQPSTIAADDWVCTTPEPVTDVHWWGSYIGWKEPTPPPPGLRPPVDHFHLLIWTDVPAGVDETFSHPGQVIWEAVRPLADANEQFAGWDVNPATGEIDATFRYDLHLQPSEYFYQAPGPAGTVYWITIAACYEPQSHLGPFPWGWKTRPRDPGSIAPDDAVHIFDPWNPIPGSVYSAGEPLWYPTPQDSWDLAFELTTGMTLGVIKWTQAPDTSPTGMDVHATTPYILADDFQCASPGDITQITIHGSWYHDVLPFGNPGAASFRLSLHEDIPASQNPNGPYSAPGTLLWTRTFPPGTFGVGQCGSGLLESWFEPPGFWDPFGDTVCWSYTFSLNPGEFQQTGTPQAPVIYWLDVEASPLDPSVRFGWKTSLNAWNDDGTWMIDGAPPPWQELRYPPGHILMGQSIDFAFEITGTTFQESLKWSQPPVETPEPCFYGWNEYSVYDSPQWIVADDWPCDTGQPVTDIHWWGSYLDWDESAPPMDAPTAFHIGVWTDVPFMPPGFSHPGVMLHEWIVPRAGLNERAVGCDLFETAVAPETCFKYDFEIPAPQWFYQDAACSVYWLSIAALYSVQPPVNPWGWKTREHLYMDDAVRLFVPTAPTPGAAFGAGEPIESPAGVSWDMAFTITTRAPNPPLPAPPPHDVKKNRYISFDPNNAAVPVAIRLDCDVCPSQGLWVDTPVLMSYYSDSSYVSRVVNAPVFRTWPESVVQVADAEIGPGADYTLRATVDGVNMTLPLLVQTVAAPTPHYWGDVVGRYDYLLGAWSPPQGVMDFMDIVALIHKFQNRPTAVHTTRADLDPDVPQFMINVADIARAVQTFVGFHYPPLPWNTGLCTCASAVDCDDGLFCNGAEVCNGLWCEAGADPCPRQGCDETTDTCVPCTADAECDDGLYCTGPETCQAGFCEPAAYPCGGLPCDEVTESCTTSAGVPSLALKPISATGAFTINGNEIVLHGGGQTVTLELAVADWGPQLLSTYQGTVKPDGYLGKTAFPPSPGVDLVPVGWPSDPDSGAFVDGTRGDFVFSNVTETHAVARPTQQYEWGAASWQSHASDVDVPKYAGTLLLNVPPAAQGTYIIHFNTDPTLSWFTDQNWADIPVRKFAPAMITVVIPQACCLANGTCVETDHTDCVARGGDPQGDGTVCDLRVCDLMKWAQPPVYDHASPNPACFWGWDEHSHNECPGCPLLADDWLCDSEQPVSDVHWWGSYLGRTDPTPPPVGLGPDFFHIGIWTNIPAGVDQPWSHPGQMMWEWMVPRSEAGERYVGCDFHPGFAGGDACFRYDFAVPSAQWFVQGPQCDLFWISISAIYQQPPLFTWGWKTRPHFFEDDAVRIFLPNPAHLGMVFQQGMPVEYPAGVSWDMAFVLTTSAVFPPADPPFPYNRQKNRYVSFAPNNGPNTVAFAINKTTGVGMSGWVGAPDAAGVSRVVAAPVMRVWPETVIHVGDCEIVPVATYTIAATADGVTFSAPLTVGTIPLPAPKFWGDTVGQFGVQNPGMWDPPNGVVNVNDFVAAMEKFQNPGTNRVHMTVVDVVGAGLPGQEACLNETGNIADVFNIIKAFQGNAYPFTTDPGACPPCP
ncbi:MAG: hypothetical protein HY763_16080 [Planctomycetes bacterium]|nr:hypothetical protein [Planctomycetota bacterium]